MARLEYELAYYDVAVQYVSDYATGIPQMKFYLWYKFLGDTKRFSNL